MTYYAILMDPDYMGVYRIKESRRFLNINGMKVPRKTVVVYDKTDKTYHILKSDGTLGKKIDKVRA